MSTTVDFTPAWARSLRHHPLVGQDPPAVRITPADDDGGRALWTALSIAGTVVGAYHGYARNESVGWAIGWGLLGGIFPFIVIPIAYAQGIGEPAGA